MKKANKNASKKRVSFKLSQFFMLFKNFFKKLFSFLKPIYLAALFPILSTGLYLLLMGLSSSEDFGFGPLAIIGFLAVSAAWGAIGYLFARSKTLLFPSTMIAHIIPIATTVIYTILFLIAQFSESEAMEELALLIGGLGTGFFGILGTLLYAIIPMTLFEVYINFGFMVIVFIVGFTIGATARKKK